ncbi:NUDIX domain-containing protein [Salipiger sp. IMCC34102]|uniref:NUDIX domain-containing protein n=1 Tax=Salipiger sp. IMCC34102 TaxID=2510647 RepID=UPI00101CBAAF|nr:NUDIX hydrolase [Salipiger sp. IMCC34102]RYH04199.1 NUDIX domain-containing protein [Salipiger sp. IMCC34102]
MIRRFGDTPRKGVTYGQRSGVYAILMRRGQMLATWQGAPHFELQLPGGGIDPGEHPLTALHREVYEETGWRIASPRRLGAFRRFTWMPEYERHAMKVCTVYLARPVLPLGPPTEPKHTAVWLDPADAVRMLANDGDADMLARVLHLA